MVSRKEELITRILADTGDFIENKEAYKEFLESLNPKILELFALEPTMEAAYMGTFMPIFTVGGTSIDREC